jgi:phospho-N-acetylmuramoyl-pentapeptide-transferase
MKGKTKIMNLRGFWALLTAFAICAIIGPFLIPILHKLHFGQSIRGCGPQEHLKKSGTPTMGGIMIIIAIVIATIIWCDITPQVLIALWLLVGHGVIGFIDDGIKIVFKRNLGLTSGQKLLMQGALAAVYLIYQGDVNLGQFSLWIPGFNANVNLGIWHYLFVVILLVGTTNAVNLTDGLDGLVSWVTVPVTLAFSFIAFHSMQPDLGIFSLIITGSCLGFLLFNRHPAKIFMGDTGSLALGGGIAALALLTKTELLLVIIGGIYVIEALSVIMQVTYFKATGGKRIFRMSPLHHHFELGGWKETKVVWFFSFISLSLSVLGVILFILK